MLYKNHDIISVTIFGNRGTQIYRTVYIIAPDGKMTKTNSEAKAREIVDENLNPSISTSLEEGAEDDDP